MLDNFTCCLKYDKTASAETLEVVRVEQCFKVVLVLRDVASDPRGFSLSLSFYWNKCCFSDCRETTQSRSYFPKLIKLEPSLDLHVD